MLAAMQKIHSVRQDINKADSRQVCSVYVLYCDLSAAGAFDNAAAFAGREVRTDGIAKAKRF